MHCCSFVSQESSTHTPMCMQVSMFSVAGVSCLRARTVPVRSSSTFWPLILALGTTGRRKSKGCAIIHAIYMTQINKEHNLEGSSNLSRPCGDKQSHIFTHLSQVSGQERLVQHKSLIPYRICICKEQVSSPIRARPWKDSQCGDGGS